MAVEPREEFPIIALVASAGGVAPLVLTLAALPAQLPAAVLVLLHMQAKAGSALVDILARSTDLEVAQAHDGDLLSPGKVFVAPPGSHLLIGEEGELRLSQAAPVHFLRPSADTLLASMAERFGPRVIAVILSGTGSDGADGVQAVKRCGGTIVVQDDESSAFGGMPQAAVDTGRVDFVLPDIEIGAALARLVVTNAAA